MKHMTFTLKASLLGKLLLAVTMMIGGGSSAWGDTVVLSGSTYNSTDWGTGNIASPSNKLSVPGETDLSNTGAFTSQPDYLQGYKYTWYAFYSNNTIAISTGQKIVISAQGMGSTSAKLCVRISSTSKTDNSTYSAAATFTTEIQSSTLQDGFTDLVVSDVPSGSYYIQIVSKAVNINGITIQDSEEPVLSVSPDTDAEFGFLAEIDTKTYTVSNIGSGSLDVTISNSNTTDFTISKTSISGISGGESDTFTITFNYNNEDLGEKTAIITITPNVGDAVEITASATAISDNAPQLSVSPDDDTDLGSVYSGNVTYTVTNTGTGSMSVDISSDNSDFDLDKTSIADLAHGESETFTVTYTFDPIAEKLGLNSANITVTPTYDAKDAKTYEVSATSNATFTLDEDNAWETGPGYMTKPYLHVKYTPVDGWNTICMPFILRNTTMNNMDAIFGEGWKAFTLHSYTGGVLTFSKISSSYVMQGGTPFLVYIEKAPSHPLGVLFTEIAPSGNNPGSASNGSAIFQGTYVTKNYNADTDVENPWYGVTPAGRIMKAGTGAYVKGYRAYFTGVSAPSDPASGGEVKMFILDDDDIPTDLSFVKMVDENAKEVYNLAGQKVQKGRKGIYIVNGKKVVIK